MGGIGWNESICICSNMRVASNKAVLTSCFPRSELNWDDDDELDQILGKTSADGGLSGSMISCEYFLL